MPEETENQVPFEGYGNTNGTVTVNPDKKITYHHYGKLAAKNTNSNSANLISSLDNIYERFLNEQQLNEMLLNIDYDQNGYVTIQDFIQMTKQLRNF